MTVDSAMITHQKPPSPVVGSPRILKGGGLKILKKL